MFRQTGGAMRRGVFDRAEGATPSEQSAQPAPPVVRPIWRKFVAHEGFREANREAIREEESIIRESLREERARQREATRPDRWKPGIGTLTRITPDGVHEEHDPESLLNDPVVGAFAAQSLFKRDIKQAKDEADALSLKLSDPSDRRKLTERERADLEGERSILAADDPRSAELKKIIDGDDGRRSDEQAAFDARKRLQEIAQGGVTGWLERRRSATPLPQRQEAVAKDEAELDAAEKSAIEEEDAIREKLRSGVRATELPAIQARQAELAEARNNIAIRREKPASELAEISELAKQDAARADSPAVSPETPPAAPAAGRDGMMEEVFGMMTKNRRATAGAMKNVSDQEWGVGRALEKAKDATGALLDDVVAGLKGLVSDPENADQERRARDNESGVVDSVLKGGDLVAAYDAAKAKAERFTNPAQAAFREDGLKRAEVLGDFVRYFQEKGITDGREMGAILADSAKQNVWAKADDDSTRVLSDGTVAFNPSLVAERDAQKAASLIDTATSSPEQKEAAKHRLALARQDFAANMHKQLLTRKEEGYAEHVAAKTGEGVTAPEAVLFSWKGLDSNWLSKNWGMVRDGSLQALRGIRDTARAGAAGAMEGLGTASEQVGAEGLAKWWRQGAVDATEKLSESRLLGEYEAALGEMRGERSGIRGIGQDLISTVGQMAPMFVGGGAGRIVMGGAEAGTGRAIAGSLIAGGGVYGWAGLQGYSSIIQSSLSAAEAKAKLEMRTLSDDERAAAVGAAQIPALANGFQTAILSRVLGEGVERAALAKLGQSMTAREALTRLAAASKSKGVRAAFQELKPELKAMLKVAGHDYKDETIEESLNQFIEGVISVATVTPNKPMADVVEESVVAGLMAGPIGAGIPVAQGLIVKSPAGKPLPKSPDEQRGRVTAEVVSEDPRAPEVQPEEMKASAELVGDFGAGPQTAALEKEIAEAAGEQAEELKAQLPKVAATEAAAGVRIHRELAQVEAEVEDAVAGAEENLAGAQASGDPAAVATAVENLRTAEAGRARVPRARGVLKISKGDPLAVLTDAEVRALGISRDGKPLKEEELASVGLAKPLLDLGPDGSPILLDEAAEELVATSPAAEGRVTMSETEARKRSLERSAAPKSRGKAGGNFRVTGRSGTVVQVEAADEAAAEEAGAVALPLGEQVASVEQQLQPETVGTPAPAVSPAVAEPIPAPAVKDARAPVLKHLAQVKKRIGKSLTISSDAGDRAMATEDGIVINPSRLLDEATSGGLDATQTETWIRSVVDEELRHFAHLKASRELWESQGSPGDFISWRAEYYGTLWQEEFVATGKAEVVEALYGFSLSSLSDWQKAMEGIRMMSQKLATGSPTEVAKLWTNPGARMIEALRAALKALKSMVADLSPSLKSEIAALEKQLAKFAPSPPSQSTSPDEAAPEEASAGGIEGSEISFTRDGGSQTGIVAKVATDGRLLVRVNGRNILVRPDEVDQPKGLSDYHRFPDSDRSMEAKVHAALHTYQGAEDRWSNLRESGADDATLLANIGEAIGERGGSSRHGGYDVFGGKKPTVQDMISREKISGKPLLKMVRELMEIPQPVSSPLDVAGGPAADTEWTFFSEESGTLGIPRDEMPQIKAEDRSAMVQFLKARGIDYSDGRIAPSELKPTQSEFSAKKVDAARAHEGGDRAILVSQDRHVVDGHHQWLAKWFDAPDQPIRVITLKAPINDILAALREMPSAQPAGQESSGRAEVMTTSLWKQIAEAAGFQSKDIWEMKPAELVKFLQAAEDLGVLPMTERFIRSWGHEIKGKLRKTWDQWESGERAFEDTAAENAPAIPASKPGEWTDEIQKNYRKLKAALSRVVKANEWQRVIEQANTAEAYFEKAGAYPDDWSTWTRAKEDAEAALARQEQPRATQPSAADRALLDAFSDIVEGLEAAPVGDDFRKAVPPAKIGALVDVAQKYIAEGVSTPAALASRLATLAGGKLKPFSQSIWGAFVMVNPSVEASPDWAALYGAIDNPKTAEQGEADDSAGPTGTRGEGSQASGGLEQRAEGSVDSKPGSEDAGPRDQEQLPDDGGGAGKSRDSGALGGDAPRPGAGTEARQPNDGNGSQRGGEPSSQGADPVESGDGSGVARGELPRHSPQRSGYRLTDPDRVIGTGGPKARFSRNKLALETYDTVLSERRDPTPEEMDRIAGYVGWGSFGQELFQGTWDRPNPKPEWREESEWLRDHLGKVGWESVRDSIINAHYTDPPHIQALWRIASRLGFKGGRVLEPSMGIGSFFGLMPEDIRSSSSLTGIELDRVVGGMAQMLYPDANIRIMGYEKSATADNFYDLVIGNWPFAADGPSDPRYNSFGLSLHDYFFVKALDQVRPGGLVIGITSSGTMDKKGQTARRQMAKRAELVAAFRLPTGAFEKYAGTKVVTDIIILKKREQPLQTLDTEGWMDTEQQGSKGATFNANVYWGKHPENVLGEMKFGHGTTQGRAGMIVERREEYSEQLARIEATLPEGIVTPSAPRQSAPVFQNREATADQNSVVWIDGDSSTPQGFYIVRGEQLEPLESVFKWELKDEKKNAKRSGELQSLLSLRDSISALLAGQREGKPTTEKTRKEAKGKYDAFVKEHGPIARSFMVKALTKAGDPMALTLENIERAENGKFVPRDILLKDIMRRPQTDARGSIEDAYAIQRNQSIDLDLQAVADLAGKPVEEVRERLVSLDQIYLTPTGAWVPREEYLGGNVRRKLREALDAREQGMEMGRNITALEAIQPKDIAYFEIEVQMGASWIPREEYLRFASHLLGGNPSEIEKDFELVKGTSGWNFKVLNKGLANSTQANATWGTAAIQFRKIFQSAMNGTPVKIYETDPETKTKYLNEPATQLANKKIDDIREELSNWLWADPERAGRLSRDYNEVMNSEVVPKRNGSHLRFEGLTLSLGRSEFDFRQHQKDAVWRFIMDGRGLAAHEVGTGKTFTMAGLAVEGRRLGRFRKSLVFAHNANAESVFRDFQAAYPSGRFLFIDNLSPENRDNAMRQIATDEWDAVIVPHSLIDRFALREATLMEIANKQIVQLESEIADALEELGVDLDQDTLDDDAATTKALKYVKDSYTAKELVKTRNRIIKRIKDKAAKSHKDNAVFFEDLGVDGLFVDEAHIFKKISLATRKEVKGLNKTESERGWMLGALADTVKSKNNGKGVFLFTGTPLTNNLNEAYNMMRFVMDDAMEDAGIENFDDWFNSFAASVTDVELTTGGTFEPVNRLLSFINVPELARLAGRYFDVVQAKDMPEFVPRDTEDGKSPDAIGRPFKTVRPAISEMSAIQKAHKKSIQARYEAFQKLEGKAKRKAMLEGTDTPIQLETEGVKAALDFRLVDPKAPDHEGSKVNVMLRNAMGHYLEDDLSTQMIFMERGFNDFTDADVALKDGKGEVMRDADGKRITQKVRRAQFNLVRDMVEKLVAQGVRPEEIAVFSNMSLDPIAARPDDVLRKVNRVSAKSSKEDLAAEMRVGKIRFAIGSTQTMGTGVNAQTHMRAMHHLDAPWTPGEFEQRNGRGHRQGNEWNAVFEYRYLTEGSHDGRRWQVLLNKVKFISRFTSMLLDAGGSGVRVLTGDGADLGEGGENVADFEQSFSTAAGDPRILVRAKLRTDVDKLERKRNAHFQSIARAKSDIKDLERRKKQDEATIGRTDKTVAAITAARALPFKLSISGQEFTERSDAEEFLAAFPSLTQKDDKKVIADFNGIKVVHEWIKDTWGSDSPSRFYAHIPIEGESDQVLAMGKLSLASLDGTLRGQTRILSNLKDSFSKIDGSIQSLQEMAKKPFTRDDELEAKKNALQQIEVELNRAPQPAPSWLRHGAPVGSLIYLEDGKAYDVAAHRWDENGWWVLIENDEGMRPIDYRKVRDDSGHPMFEEVAFTPPDKAAGQQSPEQLDAAPLTSVPEFYSQLLRVIEEKVPDNASAMQVLATVHPSRGTGVKLDELRFSGLDETLRKLAAEHNGKIPKAALLTQLRAEGSARFVETVIADATKPEVVMEDGGYSLYDRGEFVEWYEERDEADAAIATLARVQGEDAVQYKAWALPGGENYREVVLATGSARTRSADQIIRDIESLGYNAVEDNGWHAERQDDGSSASPPGAVRRLLAELNDAEISGDDETRAGQSVSSSDYRSRHFKKIAGYLGHYRSTDRSDPKGSPGLFIEEIQSDRHQEGRKKGYALAVSDTLPEGWGIQQKDGKFQLWREGTLGRWLQGTFKKREQALEDAWAMINFEKIPDAPFQKDWWVQLFKRALRDAVVAGKDWIGWTTGATQEERFDLRKQVSRINLLEKKDGTFDIVAFHDDAAGRRGRVFAQEGIAREKLEDFIGKDAAGKILAKNASPEGLRVLEGNDLAVEAAGMRAFYDRILPSDIGKYLKKWSVKPELAPMPLTKGTVQIWKVPITEDLRESVAKGQALYAASLVDVPAAEIRSLQARIDRAYESGKTTGVEELEARLEELLESADSDLQGFDDVDPETIDDSFPDPASELINLWSRYDTDRSRGESFPQFVRAAVAGSGSWELQDGVTDEQIDAAKDDVLAAYRRRRASMRGAAAAPLRDEESARNTADLILKAKKQMAGRAIEKEVRDQQSAFADQGKVVGRPDLANISGDETVRAEMDVIDELRKFTATRERKLQWEREGNRLAESDEGAVVEKWLQNAYSNDGLQVRPEDVIAARVVMEKRVKAAGNDLAKHAENAVLLHGYREARANQARVLAAGADPFKKPEQRHRDYLAGVIYDLPKKTVASIEGRSLTPAAAREAIRQAVLERLKKVEGALKKMGVTIDEIVGGQVFLSLSQAKVIRDATADLSPAEKLAIKTIQAGGTFADVRRKTGLKEDKVQKLVTDLRAKLAERLREKVAAGMKLEDLRDELKGLSAAALAPEDVEAEIERILTVGFGLPASVPATRLPKRKPKKVQIEKTDWNRPTFADGLTSYEFDKKDRAEVMRRATTLREIAGVTGRIAALTGAKKAEAVKLVIEMNKILGKYGTSVEGVLREGSDPDSYRFNIADRHHVLMMARMISALDADLLDKGAEYYYSSILSGLQTMIVNASTVIPSIWEATIGRGIEMATNALFRDPKAASLGEIKYILRASGPMLARAWSNAAAAWGTETPYFEEDVLGKAPDLDRFMEGRAIYRTGSISGAKGRVIRIPTRLLLATDEFVRTANACMEVGAMAYRLAKASGLKEGTADFDAFLKKQVNLPGSPAWQMASLKASDRTFTSALPGQMDVVSGKKVPVKGIGDVVGLAAGSLAKLFAYETDNLAAKAALLAVRLIFFPFQRVPFNIIRQAARRTLNPISAADIGIMFARNLRVRDGKWTLNAAGEKAEIVERLSQQAQGGLLLLLLAATGIGEGDDDDLEKPLLITGSRPIQEVKRGERELGYRLGLGPYEISIKTPGGKRVGFSYGRMEPAATVLGATVDTMREFGFAKDGKQAYGEAGSKAINALVSQLTEKTFLRGFSDAHQIMSGDADLTRFAAERIAVIVPNIIRQPVRETDPVFREKADGFIEALSYAMWPHGQLPEKRDVYGDTQDKKGTSAGRIIDFTDFGGEKAIPYDEMLWRYRLKKPSAAYAPQSAEATFTDPKTKKSVKMNATQAARFKQLAGARTLALLKGQHFNLKDPSEVDIERFRETVTRARGEVRRALVNSTTWRNLK